LKGRKKEKETSVEISKSSTPFNPINPYQSVPKGIEHTYSQHARIYLLFNKVKIKNELLKKLQTISSTANSQHLLDTTAVLTASRDFMNDIMKKDSSFCRLYGKDFLQALCSARFGIPVEAFIHNIGLQEFLDDQFNPIKKQEDIKQSCKDIIYNPDTKEVFLNISNQKIPWKELRKRYVELNTALVPCMRLSEGRRPKTYEMEVVTLCQDDRGVAKSLFRSKNEHSWIRLKTPDGDVYSFGLNPKRKVTKLRKIIRLFRADLSGVIITPDPGEKYCRLNPEKIMSKSIPIDQKAFNFIKKMIENPLYRSQINFDLFSNNCTDFAVSLLKAASNDPEITQSLTFKASLKSILPKWLQTLSGVIHRRLQSWRKKHSPSASKLSNEIAYPRALREWIKKNRTKSEIEPPIHSEQSDTQKK